MKSILILVMLWVSVNADNYLNALVKQRYNLTKEQSKVANYSYNKGKIYDMGLTLEAIAWEESIFGKYRMNLSDGDRFKFKGSFGPYHALLNTVCNRHNIKTYWTASRTAEKLVLNIKFSSTEAIIELMYWRQYWTDKKVKRVWSHTVASYNAGYASYNSKSGKKYLKRIIAKAKALKIYHNIKYTTRASRL